MALYTYSLTAFTGLLPEYDTPAIDRLTNEVAETLLVPALTDITVGPEGHPDDCVFDFDGTLSAGQQSLLDSVVAAHDGTPLPDPEPPTPGLPEFYEASSEGNSSTTSTAWMDKVVLEETPEGGTYEIVWYAETWANASNKEYGFRVVLDGETILGWSDSEHRGKYPENAKSGFAIVELDDDEHSVAIQFCRIESCTAYIRRARITMRKVAE